MVTYDEIYERMKSEYVTQSGVDFDEASDVAIRMRILAGEIYNMSTNTEWLKNQMFISTASGEFLDYFASQRGIQRKPAQKAQGEITFFISEPQDTDIYIPVGTTVATSDAVPVRFVTTEEEYIKAGGTLKSVAAEAEKAGSNGNTLIETVNIMVDVPAEVEYAYNREAFVGGCDEESDDDLRKRIKDSLLVPSNGTNAAYYKKLALTVPGITKAGVVAKMRGTGTVNVFVSNGSSAPAETAIAEAQALISENRELNVDVEVLAAQNTLVDLEVEVNIKDGYKSDDVKQMCADCFNAYLDEIEIGGTLYLAELGKRFMNTGGVQSYVFSPMMEDFQASGSQCLTAGTVNVTVV